MIRFCLALSGLLAIAGCASAPRVLLTDDHPASPDAPVVDPPPSTTQAIHQPALTPAPPTSATTVAAAPYICPHHPEVVSDQPGNCPKCRMKLLRKEARP